MTEESVRQVARWAGRVARIVFWLALTIGGWLYCESGKEGPLQTYIIAVLVQGCFVFISAIFAAIIGDIADAITVADEEPFE
jgi:hypothetical protein